jgi:hypothetical protein
MPLIVEIAQALVHGLGTHLDAKLMLGDLPRNAWHVRRLPCEDITISTQEVDKRTFLFGGALVPDLHSLGRVVEVNLDGLAILGRVEGAGWSQLVAVATPSTTISRSLLSSAVVGSSKCSRPLVYACSKEPLTVITPFGPGIFSLR